MIFTSEYYKGEPIGDYSLEYKTVVENVNKFTKHGSQYNYILSLGNFKNTDIVADIGGGRSYLLPFISKNMIKLGYVIDKGVEDEVATFRDWYTSYFDISSFAEGRCVVLKMNAESLPFKDNYLDKVITVSALEHFADIGDANADFQVSREIYRTLKPGGLFIGSVDFNFYTTKPQGELAGTVYTLDSFIKRIVNASNWQLVGDTMVGVPSHNNLIDQLYFVLRKPQEDIG